MPMIDVDTLPVCIVELDERRRISAVNAEAESVLAHSRRTLHGRPLNEFLHHDLMIFELIDRAIKGGGERSAAGLELRGPGMRTVKLDVLAAARDNGGITLIMTPCHVDGRRRAHSDGLANFGKLLGHEIKNPLAGISGAVQLLRRKARTDQEELMELVLNECKRINRLINELSAFELFSQPKLAPVNVHGVLDQVIRGEDVAFGQALKLVREFDPSLPKLDADADHLHEAFQNLVRNACESVQAQTNPPGRITIRTRYAAGVTLVRAGRPPARAISISIIDNGPGIAPAQQSRIFEMFHTTKTNGSGLGLTVVSQIVNAHGGELTLESKSGRTDFTIYLPIARETAT